MDGRIFKGRVEVCRRINYCCELFDEESGTTSSNCVRFGGGEAGTGGEVERVAGWSSVINSAGMVILRTHCSVRAITLGMCSSARSV